MVEELAGKKGKRKGYKQLFWKIFFFFDFSDRSHDIQFFSWIVNCLQELYHVDLKLNLFILTHRVHRCVILVYMWEISLEHPIQYTLKELYSMNF